jgi:hypothetical protein
MGIDLLLIKRMILGFSSLFELQISVVLAKGFGIKSLTSGDRTRDPINHDIVE